ncbi:hypothetical protein OROHE_026297 [Orobanche hederae]
MGSLDLIIQKVDQKINEHLSEDDLQKIKEYITGRNLSSLTNHNEDMGFFLSTEKVIYLIYHIPTSWPHELNWQKAGPDVDINTSIVDGMFPLHLAVMTSSFRLVVHLTMHSGAKLDVRCDNPNSEFHGMTPFQLAMDLLSKHVGWTPELSVSKLLCLLSEEKAEKLLDNIYVLLDQMPGIRDIFYKYTQDDKVFELAALSKVASPRQMMYSSMYVPTPSIPCDHHFGLPMTLRLLVATKVASLIKEGIQLSSTGNSKEEENLREKLKVTNDIMTLLELAERDLLHNYKEQPLIEEDCYDITKGSQDESKVNILASQYLNTSLFYIEPSISKPPGIINSLLPYGYTDKIYYDGHDIRNGSSLMETIFRVLNGRKVEELNYVDTRVFHSSLMFRVVNKVKEVQALMALEEERARGQAEHNGMFHFGELDSLTPRKSFTKNHMQKRAFHTIRTSALATAGVRFTGRRHMSKFFLGEEHYDDFERVTHCCPDLDQRKCIEGHIWHCFFDHSNNKVTDMSISTIASSYNSNTHQFSSPAVIRYIQKVDWSSFTSKDLSPMKEIIESDDAERFKSLLLQSKINARPDGVKLCYDNSEICPFAILGKICHHRAYNCATLLLDHEVGSMMDLNLLNCCGSFPIHDAAISLSASMVKLLLDHGARRETLYSDPVTGQDITPLDCAVERLSCDGNLINWSPNKSVFKLIIILCLPQMKEARETISLLIPGVETCSRVLPDALLKCVKRGQVASVASLLLVDRVEVCDDVFFMGDGLNCASLQFSRSILNELASLINQEYALMGRNEHTRILQLCLEKKKLMIYILHLLEIFKRVGPGLESYENNDS